MASLVESLRPSDPTAPSAPAGGGGDFSTNVGQSERVASGVAGGLMVVYGLSKGSLGGLLIAAAGAAVAHRGLTGHCSLYEKLGVSTADADAHGRTPPQKLNRHGVHVEVSYTIDKPRQALYGFWRDFTNLPKFMGHLKSVTVQDGTRSHWVAEGSAGTAVSWDADVINDVPGEVIAWHSRAGGDVETAGSIRFRDGPPGRGTEVSVTMQYIPPGGKAGAAIAKLLGRSGEGEVREDLRRFKQLMEAGEIPTTDGQSHGSRSPLGEAVLSS
jgi:uncharacterized membrane protein